MSVRSLAGAVSWLSLGNLIVRALSLVTMPLLTRWLSPQAYGEAALVATVVSLTGVEALAGVDMGYLRHAHSAEIGSEAEVESFCWRWAIGSGLALAMLAGLSWWAFLARWLGASERNLLLFVTGGVFTSVMATMATTRARLQGRYPRLAIVQIATGCVMAATSLTIAFAWRQDAWPLLVAMLVGYGLPALLIGTPPLRQLASSSGLTQVQRRRLLSVGLAGVVTAPAYWVLSSSDRWFLAAYHDSATVGIYSIGFTVGTVGTVISAAVTGAWLPELARHRASRGGELDSRAQDMVLWLIGVLLVVAVAVTAAGGDLIRGMADRRFQAAAEVVPMLAAGVFFYGCLQIGNALLLLAGKLHWAAIAWLVAIVVSMGLNYWLIPEYGAWGAALVQALSFLLVMVLTWWGTLRATALRLPSMRIVIVCVLGLVSGALMRSRWNASPWLSMAEKLPVGVAMAAACLWVLVPQQVMGLLNGIRGRI